jgi:hypothetical protein
MVLASRSGANGATILTRTHDLEGAWKGLLKLIVGKLSGSPDDLHERYGSKTAS